MKSHTRFAKEGTEMLGYSWYGTRMPGESDGKSFTFRLTNSALSRLALAQTIASGRRIL
jgi:hypothetical protein